MRSYTILFVFVGLFTVVIHSRPSQSDENNESQEEIEYEGDNGNTADDGLETSRVNDGDPSSQDLDQNRRLLDVNRNTYLRRNLPDDRVARTDLNMPDYKLNGNRNVRNDKIEDAIISNEEYQTYTKRRQPSRYIENTDTYDQLEAAQHLTNSDVNNYKNNRVHNNIISENPINKRTVEARTPPSEGGLLFENANEHVSKEDKSDYINNEPLQPSQRKSYARQYYNRIETDNRDILLNGNNRRSDNLYFNRDRREIVKTDQVAENDPSKMYTVNESPAKSESESEEITIRRHIKKMSSDEVEQLLKSLSDEKRALLKKIIDDDEFSVKNDDVMSKREITKKAGAAEDNSFIDIGQSESSKIQDGVTSTGINIDTPSSQNPDTTEINKASDQHDITLINTKTSSQEGNIENKVELKDDIALMSDVTDGDSNKNLANIAPNEQVTSKNEKREANLDSIADVVSFEDLNPSETDTYTKESRDEDAIFSQNEDSSLFLVDEQLHNYDDAKVCKRDIEKITELDSKLKSLEESFPNSDSYDESGPYTGPLIRVKRKNTNQIMKKRSAAILPEAKVGFFPYRAENDDEDNDEGNEFDDDGFYDRTSHFANSENKNTDANPEQIETKNFNCKLGNGDQVKSTMTPVNSDTMSLGSDTDSVLSGIEGVDENLMYSSGTRNRRKSDDPQNSENADETNMIQTGQDKNSDLDSTGSKSSNNNMNIPIYQENDAFGSLPRNYEGDLGRYKRIRRVKQSHESEHIS